MPLKKSTPGEGGRPRRTHFTYVKTPHGGMGWTGYLAGPPYWCICHTVGKSKPCLSWITDGALACPQCQSVKPPEEIAYVPLFRETDHRPVMVICHDHCRDQLDAIHTHARVRVYRAVGETEGASVSRAEIQTPKWSSSVAEFNRPADLTETLLRVWAIPALTEWYARTNGRSGAGVQYTPPPLPPPPPPPSPPPADGPSADLFGAAVNRLVGDEREFPATHRPAPVNGKHKKGGG